MVVLATQWLSWPQLDLLAAYLSLCLRLCLCLCLSLSLSLSPLVLSPLSPPLLSSIYLNRLSFSYALPAHDSRFFPLTCDVPRETFQSSLINSGQLNTTQSRGQASVGHRATSEGHNPNKSGENWNICARSAQASESAARGQTSEVFPSLGSSEYVLIEKPQQEMFHAEETAVAGGQCKLLLQVVASGLRCWAQGPGQFNCQGRLWVLD